MPVTYRHHARSGPEDSQEPEEGRPASLRPMTNEHVRSPALGSGWDGAGAPGGASQGQSLARGAPDPAPRSGVA